MGLDSPPHGSLDLAGTSPAVASTEPRHRERAARRHVEGSGERRGWRTVQIAAAVWLLWTVLALLSVAQIALTAPPGPHPPWPGIVLLRFADWYTCLLFIPPFIWLTRRYPVTETGWLKSISLLFVASALFVVLKYLIFFPINRAVTGRADITLSRLLLSNALIELIIFWAVIAVIQAFEFHRRLREQEHNAVALQAQLVEANLATLSAQLQPHFLFNTLGAVTTLMHRDVAAADQMITRLGDLLRATLAPHAGHEIALGAELDLLDRYLDIMRIRFSDRLTVTIDVAADVRDAMVPRLLLQPLVENALEHGIARRVGPGRVVIAAARQGEFLHITVTDDGPGPVEATTGDRGRVGLANTRARLAQLYGGSQSLTLARAASGSGACATIVVPWRTENDGNAA